MSKPTLPKEKSLAAAVISKPIAMPKSWAASATLAPEPIQIFALPPVILEPASMPSPVLSVPANTFGKELNPTAVLSPPVVTSVSDW